MTDAASTNAQAIASLLTGLAKALTDAQEELSEAPPTDAFGRALPSYQIPHLDFTFEIETTRKEQGDSPFARFAIVPTGKTSASNSTVSSSISGRVVAVPPHGGLPETRIVVTQTKTTLDVQLLNTAGELLPNTLVELEFDPDASLALHNSTLTPAKRRGLFEAQQVATDDTGSVSAKVKRSQLATGQKAVVLLRAAGSETRVTIEREG